MALAGRLGVQVMLDKMTEGQDDKMNSEAAVMALFSESNGRLLLEVKAEDAAQVETHFAGDIVDTAGRSNSRATTANQQW